MPTPSNCHALFMFQVKSDRVESNQLLIAKPKLGVIFGCRAGPRGPPTRAHGRMSPHRLDLAPSEA
eukprot:3450869-Pyramimonas_sp.AAC.1